MASARIKIAVLTTSRADYGLLRWVARALSVAPDFELCLIAGGSHMLAGHGDSIREIEADGLSITERLPFPLADGSAHAAVSAAAEVMIGVSAALDRHRPDWLIVLGDRYEILGPVEAAVLHGVPICHLCGGDVTEGAIDDGIRHAITKLSHLHCPTNEPAGRRLRSMGEAPDRIVVTGSPGLDGLKRVQVLSRAELHRALGIAERRRLIAVTYHPETLSELTPGAQIGALLEALSGLPPDAVSLLITGANADPGGDVITREIEAFAAARDNAVLQLSLGQSLYFNLMRHADVVVGNSSSGLYEAPSFGVPTVNIGDRQRGRLRAESVIDRACEAGAIRGGIETALAMGRRDVQNPYGDGNASSRILDALRRMSRRPLNEVLRKPFIDIVSGGSATSQ